MDTKFYTGTGDDGKSNLPGGKEVSKDSTYTSFIGSLDEINSWLGVCRAETNISFVSQSIKDIQEALFLAQAQVAAKVMGRDTDKKITYDKVEMLEKIIEDVDKNAPVIRHFIIPGSNKESAKLDMARSLARRTEREAVSAKDDLNLPEELLSFLNRLSSTLFALARFISHRKGIEEESPSYK
ncbi:MAG: cob(I)yrinic acid a,c-diamide adenosyltransferase [Candidatus Magasanikbacteria bacterium]